MQPYNNKQELMNEIEKSYSLYDSEFADIANAEKDLRKEGVDKTPSENLAYQIGWTSLLLKWEEDEQHGLEVKTPTAEYKWNNLGNLYQYFYIEYGEYTLSQQREILHNNMIKIINWLNTLSEVELFEPEQRKWATTAAKWPIYKWVHINTVAPFKNFRRQIRKWKKL